MKPALLFASRGKLFSNSQVNNQNKR